MELIGARDIVHTGETRFWALFAGLANTGILIPPARAAEVAALPVSAGGWWHRPDIQPAARDHVITTQPLLAFVNAGRWLVQCPDCNGAQLAFENDRRFLCVDCGNQAVGGAWRPVEWPQDRADIEAALLSRPDRETRSWRPHETLVDLLRENAAHGIAG